MSDVNGFTKIGSFGVDSGTVMICDPCYVLGNPSPHIKYPRSFGIDWDGEYGFVAMNLIDEDGKHRETSEVYGQMAVISGTGYGDGVYPVYARSDENGRIVELRILFGDD